MADKGWSMSWRYYDGDWHEGDFPMLGVCSRATWLGSSVFDGARAFEAVMLDLDLRARCWRPLRAISPIVSCSAMWRT